MYNFNSNYLTQSTHACCSAFAYLVGHRGASEVNSKLVEKTWLMWTIDQSILVMDPEVPDNAKIANYDGTLVAELALHDI